MRKKDCMGDLKILFNCTIVYNIVQTLNVGYLYKRYKIKPVLVLKTKKPKSDLNLNTSVILTISRLGTKERIGKFQSLSNLKYHVLSQKIKKNCFLLCCEIRATEWVRPRVDEDRKHRH